MATTSDIQPTEQPKKSAKKVVAPKSQYFVPTHGVVTASDPNSAVQKVEKLNNGDNK